MPIGLIVMRWDERIGAEVIAKYPEDVTVKPETLMQIYSTHEYSGEPGTISLMAGAHSLMSYYAGPESGLYIILLLNFDEDPDVFEDGLADVARVIQINLDKNAFVPLLPSLFRRLSLYPSLNEERKLAMIYLDDSKRMILERLREEGSLLKSEIAVWLRDEYREGFIDVESIIQSLIKESIVKSRSVKGSPSEVVYLINDIFITRVPPIQILKDPVDRGLPSSLKDAYITEVKNFFAEYVRTEEDAKVIADLLLDPQVYETLTLLRSAIVTRDDLEKLKKKGVEDVDEVLKKLWDARMIVVLRDDAGNEYYGLQSDIKVVKIFPDYNLDLIREQYMNKIKSPQVLLEYIDVLKDQYNAMISAKQASSESSE